MRVVVLCAVFQSLLGRRPTASTFLLASRHLDVDVDAPGCCPNNSNFEIPKKLRQQLKFVF
jgi:hypothetical protein